MDLTETLTASIQFENRKKLLKQFEKVQNRIDDLINELRSKHEVRVPESDYEPEMIGI